jgi:hypothetical protein
MPPTLHAILVFLQPYAWYVALGAVSLLLSHRSQVDAWAEKNPRLAGLMKLLRSLGLDPWMFVQSVSLIAKGRLPKAVTDGSRSVRPPPLAVVALMIGALMLTGCPGPAGPGPATPAGTGAQAAELVKSVRAGAVLAVRTLDLVNAAWIDSVKTPTNEQLDVMRKTTGALAAARDILNASADVETQVREAGKQLVTVAHALAGAGVPIPPELLPVLDVVEGFLRAGGDS